MQHNRDNLLNHVLVKALIEYKWWNVGFPVMLISCFFHVVFLVLLTVFVLAIPHSPGPSCNVLCTFFYISSTATIYTCMQWNHYMYHWHHACRGTLRLSACMYRRWTYFFTQFRVYIISNAVYKGMQYPHLYRHNLMSSIYKVSLALRGRAS